MIMANDFKRVGGHRGRVIAVMEEVRAEVERRLGGRAPAGVVVTRDERDGDGAGGDKGFGGSAAGKCVQGIAQPEHGGGSIIGDERVKRRGDFVVAPKGQEIPAGPVADRVAPMEISHDK